MVFAHRLFRLPFGLKDFSAIMYRTMECRKVRYQYPQQLVDGVAELLPTHTKVVRAASNGSPHLGQYLSDLIAFPAAEIGGFFFHKIPVERRKHERKLKHRQDRLGSLDLIQPIYDLYVQWFTHLDSLPYKEEDYRKNFGLYLPYKTEEEYRLVGLELIKKVPENNPYRLDLEQNPQMSRYIIKWLEWRCVFLCNGMLSNEQCEEYSRQRMMLNSFAHQILVED